MGSRADYVAGKVAEHLTYEALLAIIGAVSPSPNQVAKICLELGIASEGEKIAKWVAVLKRESASSDDFLGTLVRIYHEKQEINEMAKGILSSQIEVGNIEIIDKMDIAIKRFHLKKTIEEWRLLLGKYMENTFFLPWQRVIEKRVKRMKVAGGPGHIVAHGTSYYTDVEIIDNEFIATHRLHIKVGANNFYREQSGPSYLRQCVFGLDLRLSIKADNAKKAYINKVPFDTAEITLFTPKAVRQARAFARWLKKEKMVREIRLEFRP